MNSDDLPILSSKLTLEHLKQHPVWGSFEEDDSEMIRPVNSPDPFTVDCDPLIIKAMFTTPGGRSFSGCVAVDRADDGVYLAEIFIDEKVYGFNVVLADLAKQQLELLRRTLDGPKEQIFPLTFLTPVKGPNGKCFSGVFSIDFA